MKQRVIQAADLFCGAGGTSTGLYAAADEAGCSVNLLAVNHWNIAIATHSANHVEAQHLCETLDGVDPRKVVPGGRLNLLVASPECTHHSNARGGRPMNDQSRASAWHVVRWAEALIIDSIIVENVREFMSWGPIGSDGRPLKSRRGETFRAWLKALESLNYSVDHRILNAADYGDPTTRERLFVMARRGKKRIHWPEPTHTPDGKPNLFGKTRKWRAAREIIQWDLQGQSIFNRKKPLSPNTLRRIAVGLRKFGGIDLEPFLVKLYGTNDGASINKPCPTVTATGNHLGMAEPFILPKMGRFGKNQPRSVDKPMQTVIPHHGAGHLVQPFLVQTDQTGSNGDCTRSVEKPTSTVISKQNAALIQPFLIPQQSKGAPRTTEKPLPTVCGKGAISFIVPFFGEKEGQEPRTRSVEDPAPTVTSHGAGGLVEPFITEFHGHRKGGSERVRSVKRPLPTVTSNGKHFGLAQPFLMSAGGPEVPPRGVDKPANTVLTRDHMGLVDPYLVTVNHGEKVGGESIERRVKSVDEPAPAVTGKNGLGVARAFLVQYNGTSEAQSVEEPVGTVTGKHRFALVEIGGRQYYLDIRFRMLTPRELARAQGFPDSYKFTGTQEAVVKQIGNAVPVNLAKALCKAVLAA